MALRPSLLAATTLTIGVLATCPARADALADDIQAALTHGTPNLELRPRIEVVSPDNSKTDALALTMRMVMGYTTKPIYGLSASAEMLAVMVPLNAYNSQVNGKTSYAQISDPPGINLGQGILRYQKAWGPEGIDVKAGRQVIALDDQRFFGKSDFRQNYQSIDSVLTKVTPFDHFSVLGGWGWNIKNALDNSVPSRIVIGQATYAPLPALTVDGFGYFYANQSEILYSDPQQIQSLGVPNCGLKIPKKVKSFAGCDNEIYGGRARGKFTLTPDLDLTYKATYAHQAPYEGGSALIDADLVQAKLKLIWRGIDLGGEYMLLGSNATGTYGFQTLQSTKHLFNGWAELFQTTPNNGLQTLATSLSIPIGRTTLYGKYYNFHSDYGNIHDGDEIDVSLGYSFTKHIKGAIEFADYMPAHFGVHTNLAYAYLSVKY